MTGFDYVVATVVIASVLLGAWRGVVGEIIALLAWVMAFFAARWWGEEVAQAFFSELIADASLRIVAAWIVVFVGVLVLMGLLRLAVRGMLKALGLGLSDRLLGLFFGLVRGGLIVLVLVAFFRIQQHGAQHRDGGERDDERGGTALRGPADTGPGSGPRRDRRAALPAEQGPAADDRARDRDVERTVRTVGGLDRAVELAGHRTQRRDRPRPGVGRP